MQYEMLLKLSKDELIDKVIELDSILNEFQESSKELERALESELEEQERIQSKLHKELKTTKTRLNESHIKIRELNSELNELQTNTSITITRQQQEISSLQSKLVKIEIINDSMESQDRIVNSKYSVAQQLNNELLEKIAILEDDCDRERKLNIERQLHITNYQNQIRELVSRIESLEGNRTPPSEEDETAADISMVTIREMLRSSPPLKFTNPLEVVRKSGSLKKLKSLTRDIDLALNGKIPPPLLETETTTATTTLTSSTYSPIKSRSSEDLVGTRKKRERRLSHSKRFLDLPSIKGSPTESRIVSLRLAPVQSKPVRF